MFIWPCNRVASVETFASFPISACGRGTMLGCSHFFVPAVLQSGWEGRPLLAILFELQNVSFAYDRIPALRGLSLEVAGGEASPFSAPMAQESPRCCAFSMHCTFLRKAPSASAAKTLRP